MELYLNNSQYGQTGVDNSLQSSLQNTVSSSAVAAGKYDNTTLTFLKGQIISGEIASVDGNEIQILLSDNQMVHARLTADIALAAGQIMSFQVKQGMAGNQIALTPLFENMEESPAVLKALNQAGMPANERTVAMVNEMMRQGMSISRDSLFSMLRTVNNFSSADIPTLVQMTKLQIPVTEENIAQFQAYQENRHQISDSVAQLSEGLSQLAGEEGKDTALKLLEIFTEEVPDAPRQLDEEGSVVVKKMPGEMSEASAGAPSDAPSSEGMPLPEGTQASQIPLSSVLDAAGREALTLQLKGFLPPEQAQQIILNESTDVRELLTRIADLIKSAPPEAEKAVEKLLQGKEFQSLFKENIMGQWMFKPEDVEDKERVEKLYRRILDQTEKTGQLLEQIGKGNSNLMKGTESLKQNVNFMNQLNELFTYVQLPLKLGQEKGHGDLYVYTNRKKLAKRDGEVSALLHLEMDHLGTMDVHVALRDGNRVKTHFYLADEAMIDFIEEHLPMLDERLNKRGYQMTAVTSVRDKDSGEPVENQALHDMFGSAGGGMRQLVARYSFDAKA